MNINEITRVQTGLKQISQDNKVGKKIVENAEYNVINELMGKIKGKKGKKGQNQAEKAVLSSMQTNPAYNLSLSGPQPPNWDKIFTKREPAMTDDEFESAIKALAIEYAEKALEIGNSGKSSSMINKDLYNLNRAFEEKGYKLQMSYVSVVSPDRKAAYTTADFTKSDSVYGNTPNIYGENKLMMWGPGGWNIIPTSAEQGRIQKFNNIYVDTLKTYEAENGVKIPYTTISKSVAPNRNYM